MNNQELNIIINAQDRTKGAFDSSQSSFNKFKNGLDNLQPAFKKMAVVGTVAFGAIASGALSMVKSYSDAQAQTVITNQSLANSFKSLSEKELKNLQSAVGKTGDALKGLSAESIKAGESAVKLGFDDETASRSFAKLFALTKDVTKANKELAIAQDLARFKGISLEDATQKLVMVHSGATKELKALGIAVDDTATAEQNLESIHKQTADAGKAFADTTAGAMEILKVQTDNLKESIGGALAPVFTKLLQAVQPIVEKMAKWAEQNPDLLAKLILLAGAIAGLVTVVGLLGVALPAIIAGFTLLASPITLIVGLIVVALIPTIMLLIELWPVLVDGVKTAFYNIGETIMAYTSAIKATIQGWLLNVELTWKRSWTAMSNFFKDIWNGIVDAGKTAMKKVDDLISPILSKIESVISKMKEIGGNVTGGIKGAVGKVGSFLGINDGIVHNGKIITTHPDDYIVATKTPETLGGGKGGIIVNINGGNYLSEDASLMMGDQIIKALQYQMRGS